MKCDYCGAEVSAGEIFCRICGTRLSAAPKPEPVSEPLPQAEEPDFNWQEEIPEIPRPDLQMPKIEQPAPQPVQEIRYIPYGVPEQPRKAPLIQLPTERSLAKMILLGLITLGIYPIVIWSRIVTELNIAASRYDGERTIPYFGACLLTPFTLCIYPFVWMHGFCRRVGTELKRRGIGYEFGADKFWLWNVLGSLILVGPFVFTHKLMKAMNMLNRDFNVNG